MLLKYHDMTIRSAAAKDAPQLAAWWNDGKVMAHAGFPKGLNITPSEIEKSLAGDTDAGRRLILELSGQPIGEMSYRTTEPGVAEIGIKICDFSQQEKGLGRRYLSMLIRALFEDLGFQKIILDTNLKNTRAQHVYELLGFRKTKIHENNWKNQLGELQSTVDYELLPEDFVDFTE